MRIICVGVLLLIFQSRLEAVDVTGKPLSEEEIQHQINEYSVEISKLCRLKAIAEWNVGNDIGNMTKELYLVSQAYFVVVPFWGYMTTYLHSTSSNKICLFSPSLSLFHFYCPFRLAKHLISICGIRKRKLEREMATCRSE